MNSTVLPFCLLYAAAAQFEARVIFAFVVRFAARGAGDGFSKPSAAMQFVAARGAAINPAAFWKRKRDVVARARLPDEARFLAKRRGVTVRQTLHEEPQMNHFVLEDFAQRAFVTVARDATYLKLRRNQNLKRFLQKRNGQADFRLSHFDNARRAREAAAPFYFARWKRRSEIFAIEFGVEALQFGHKKGVRSNSTVLPLHFTS